MRESERAREQCVSMYMYIHLCILYIMHKFVCVQILVYLRENTYIHICMHACIHTYIYCVPKKKKTLNDTLLKIITLAKEVCGCVCGCVCVCE